MPELTTKMEQNVFRLFVKRIETAYDDFEKRLIDYVEARRALGIDSKAIYEELVTSLNNGMGIFKDLSGDIESQIDFGLNTLFQVSSNEPLQELDSLMVWTLDPGAEHCDSCLYQASLPPRPIHEIPWPTLQETHGSNCGTYCKCTIEPVNIKTKAA